MHDSLDAAVPAADVVWGHDLPLEIKSFQFSEYFCHYILRSTLRSDTKMPLGTGGRGKRGERGEMERYREEGAKETNRLKVLGTLGIVELPPVVKGTGLAGVRESKSDTMNLRLRATNDYVVSEHNM